MIEGGMDLKFTKMHGAGNDFIVVDGVNQDVSALAPADWQRLAHRQLGIGADQILIVEASQIEGVDFKYTIYNQDGSLVENCGNGARCFVRFVFDKGMVSPRATPSVSVHLSTGAILHLALNPDQSVTVNMGAPNFAPDALPAQVADLGFAQVGDDVVYAVPYGDERRHLSLVSMGNPHAVQIVSQLSDTQVAQEGAYFESHSMFPRRVNVGFMQVNQPQDVHVRVYERGAGETLACGTGICAAVVTGIRRGLLLSPVRVHARGGDLTIAWAGEQSPVMMTGPAQTVFEGVVSVANVCS